MIDICYDLTLNLTMHDNIINPHAVKPVFGGHLWDKEKVTL